MADIDLKMLFDLISTSKSEQQRSSNEMFAALKSLHEVTSGLVRQVADVRGDLSTMRDRMSRAAAQTDTRFVEMGRRFTEVERRIAANSEGIGMMSANMEMRFNDIEGRFTGVEHRIRDAVNEIDTNYRMEVIGVRRDLEAEVTRKLDEFEVRLRSRQTETDEA